ncbi:hypothetical protein ABIF91_001733 [Bradyrhizobium sp. USDA 241]
MQIGMQKHVDIATAVEEEFDGEIEANAVAIYAQISGLAKDKVGYGVREIPSNAWDASRGNFEVHLPTRLSPMFRVRDYGTGISPENMRGVYGKLYASDKRKDDNKVGGWGLGSKSPFAYLLGPDGAGSFTVTSYYEGMMRTYTVSLSEEGKIKIRRLCEIATDQPSGLEVSYPVRREDIQTFHDRARTILWSFNPRPKIFPAIEWKEPVIEAQGEGWTRYKAGTVPFSRPQVRMGCVMYPFDLNQVQTIDFLAPDDVVLFEAPIGSLKVTLSREELAYDEVTKTTLKNLVSTYEQSFITQLQAKVDEATTLFGACKAFEDETSALGNYRQEQLRKVVKWNDHRLSCVIYRDGFKTCMLREGWQTFDKFEDRDIRTVNAADATVVIEHNPSYSFGRFTMAGLVGEKVLWIRCKRIDRERALARLGNPEVIDLDTFKVPVEKRTGSKTIRKRRTIVVGHNGVTKMTQEIDLADGGFYCETSSSRGWGRRGRDRYYFAHNRSSMSSYDFDSFISTCVELGILEVGQVILLKDADKDVPENWTLLGDELISELQAKIDVTQFTGLYQKNINHLDTKLKHWNESPNYRAVPTDILEFRLELAELARQLRRNNSDGTSTTSDKAYTALKKLGVHVDRPAIACPIEAINAKFNALCTKYPLLNLILKQSSYYRLESEALTQLRHYFGLLTTAQPSVEVVGVVEAEEEEDEDHLDEAA